MGPLSSYCSFLFGYNDLVDESYRHRLEEARNLWVTTVRPDGRPHLTPVWFVLDGEDLVICISGRSVKARNLAANARVACALEDGSSPLIAEGQVETILEPWPETLRAAFSHKYDWDIAGDGDYDLLLRIAVSRWLHWNA